MAKKLKVYGSTISYNKTNKLLHHCQVRAVMATTSWTKFSKALEEFKIYESTYNLSKYGCVTGNKEELKLCLDNPEQVWYRLDCTKYGWVTEYFPIEKVPSVEETKKLAEEHRKAKR